MKKAFFIFIAVAALALQSCLHDNKTVFDEPAAERLDKAVADYTALLESAPMAGCCNIMPAKTTATVDTRSC